MEYSFDPELIDKELAVAQQIGFNCLRVVLPFVVWEAEPYAFKARLDRFLQICANRGLTVMFALFDDCVTGPLEDPVFGQQPDVVEGWYANAWSPSPGRKMTRDRTCWPRLERYVRHVIERFKDDPRVWVWDLYNEPTHIVGGESSIPLVECVIQWARQIAPSQPLTVGCRYKTDDYCDRVACLSDIMTFHDYGPAETLAATIAEYRAIGRPAICTEWLNRVTGSNVAECLPLLRSENIACLHWGLVNGRTQTDLNWFHRPGEAPPPRWQHDLFYGDHTAYDSDEIEIFARACREISSARPS